MGCVSVSGTMSIRDDSAQKLTQEVIDVYNDKASRLLASDSIYYRSCAAQISSDLMVGP